MIIQSKVLIAGLVLFSSFISSITVRGYRAIFAEEIPRSGEKVVIIVYNIFIFLLFGSVIVIDGWCFSGLSQLNLRSVMLVIRCCSCVIIPCELNTRQY